MYAIGRISFTFYVIINVIICSNDGVIDEYRSYTNKRLTNVIKTVQSSSIFQCTTWCSMTDGCLAVNVIGNHDITCELTTGLSNESKMQDDSSSHLLVSSYNKCTEEPGFCLNGATCERAWTSARCLCTDRYQGDRCDTCSERFQGDGCQECSSRFQGDDCQQCAARFQGDDCQQCAARFQGDDCQQCAARFQGDNCQTCVSRFQGDNCQQCAQNYYGNNCEVSFMSVSNKRCLGTYHGNENSDNSGYHDNCKQWCVARSDCGGFTVDSGGRCYYKVCDSMMDYPGQTSYLKTISEVN